MPKIQPIILGLVSSLLLVACSNSDIPQAYQLNGLTMGTSYSITIVGEQTIEPDEINAALESIENTMSTYRSNSELMLLNLAPVNSWIEISQSLYDVMQISKEINTLSEGAFDITVAPLVDLWGFGPITRDADSIPGEDEIQALLNNVGSQYLMLATDRNAVQKTRAIHLDLSADAKGYAVDVIAALLDAHSVTDYLVEIGGEIRSKGRNAQGELWRIAIELPDRSVMIRSPQRTIQLDNISVASSGDYRNFFEFEGRFYSHSIDPRTGYPVEQELASVTVLNEKAAFADAMATALNVMGVEQALMLANRINIPAYFIEQSDDGFTARYSTAFTQYIDENQE